MSLLKIVGETLPPSLSYVLNTFGVLYVCPFVSLSIAKFAENVQFCLVHILVFILNLCFDLFPWTLVVICFSFVVFLKYASNAHQVYMTLTGGGYYAQFTSMVFAKIALFSEILIIVLY